MKMPMLSLLLTCLMTGCASDSYVERKTTTANGAVTVTETPVANPNDVLFDRRCDKVLERRFE